MRMENASGGARRILTRWLAAVALVIAYFLATAGIVATGATSAVARGRGGGVRVGRGGGRGFFRGRGRGFGGVGVYLGPYYDDGCYFSRRYRRWICPYW